MLRLGLVTLALVATPLRLLCAQGAAAENRCNYSIRYYCDENGCNSLPHEGEYLLIPDPRELQLAGIRNRYEGPPVQVRRCNAGGCTVVDVTSFQSGAFLNVWSIVGGGYMLKFVSRPLRPPGLGGYETGQFVEVDTSGLDTFISYGSCPWDQS